MLLFQAQKFNKSYHNITPVTRNFIEKFYVNKCFISQRHVAKIFLSRFE